MGALGRVAMFAHIGSRASSANAWLVAVKVEALPSHLGRIQSWRRAGFELFRGWAGRFAIVFASCSGRSLLGDGWSEFLARKFIWGVPHVVNKMLATNVTMFNRIQMCVNLSRVR